MRYQSVILWGIFAAMIVLGAFEIARAIIVGPGTSLLDLNELTPAGKMVLCLAVSIMILHSAWTLGRFSGPLFVTLSFITGLFFEVVGVRSEVIFGGRYVYDPAIHPAILGVPLLIPFMWAGFIYTGYSIVASFSSWLGTRSSGGGWAGMMQKVSLAALSALVVVTIDLFMEPLQVRAGNWQWLDGGPYFNIPAGNFSGWFMVAFIPIFIFMIARNHLPPNTERVDRQVLLIPVLSYGFLGVTLAFCALSIGAGLLAAVGLTAMLPVVAVNLMLFRRWEKNRRLTGVRA